MDKVSRYKSDVNKSFNVEIILIAVVLIILLFFILSLNGFDLTGFFTSTENNAPDERISYEDIIETEEGLTIRLKNPILTQYTDSESMAPLLGKGTIGIEISPESEEEINIGDIITFESEGKLIAHRVIEKGVDDYGIFFITKGDNNNLDDGKIRFEQVKGILVGILY